MNVFKKLSLEGGTFKIKKEKTEKHKNKSKEDSHKKNSGTKYKHENGNVTSFYQCKNLHFGNSYVLQNTNVYSNTCNPPESDTSSREGIPENVEMNFANIKEVTIEHFLIISQRIGPGWKIFGLKLGFTEEELQSYVGDEEDICSLLLSWKKAKTREATIGCLLKHLWGAGEYEAAIHLVTRLPTLDK